MKQCPNCRSQIPDEAVFCPVCGTAINAFHSFPEPYPPQQRTQTPPPFQTSQYAEPAPMKEDPSDHTSAFDASDIAENKNWCMLLYLLDIIGIALVLLQNNESGYTRFHLAQAVKFSVLEAVLAFCAVALCWTVLVPFIAGVCFVVLYVVKFICFLQVCKGKAVEPPIVRNIRFLK